MITKRQLYIVTLGEIFHVTLWGGGGGDFVYSIIKIS